MYSNPTIIGRRYILHEPLGMGSIGIVYRAIDLLNGQAVALKRVIQPNEDYSTSASQDFRLALVQEWRLLASLRHAHLVSVLDYGFDDQRQPYYTMDLLENTRTILEAGAGQPLIVQVNLLVQLLQALAYLHRRGVIHRNLRPGNVLVADGQVKVLDYGLSSLHGPGNDHTTIPVETLAYTAPESLSGLPESEASDLYAAGVIAYELLAGKRPFDAPDGATFINSVLYQPPDTASLPFDPALKHALDRLLAKTPAERCPSANDAIGDLNTAVGQSPPETTAVHNVFWQPVRLVGRAKEKQILTQALMQALDGKGSSWLIGGESGVGKSRLAEELRALAITHGALVLRGQGVSESSIPYHLWRPALRWLCLLTELDDAQYGLLKVLLPDIETLVGHPVMDTHETNTKAMPIRLLAVIEALFHRQQQPVVVILEDIHWAAESLDVLARLNPIVTSLPVLIVATYDDDEQPELPSLLPEMNSIRLEGLDNAGIVELSVAILGANGRQPRLVDMLQRKTRGNVFFLAEVVRALAEETGDPDSTGLATLTAQVFGGSARHVVYWRLKHAPRSARPLLQAAAVIGRQLDLRLLRALGPETDLNDWLAVCAEAAILEIYDGQWRFTHDRLRDGLLGNLTPMERKRLHEQAAAAIETIYPQATEQIPALAYHYGMAENTAREEHYAALAGEQALTGGAYRKAVRWLERALILVISRQDAADRALLKRQVDLRRRIAEAYLGLGQYDSAARLYRDNLERCQAGGDIQGAADDQHSLGDLSHARGDYDEAKNHYYQALSLYQSIPDQAGITRALNSLGNVAYDIGELNEAQLLYQESLHLSRETNHHLGMAAAADSTQGSPDSGAQPAFAHELATYRETGDAAALAKAFQKLLFVAEHTEAERLCRNALEQFKDDQAGKATALEFLGLLAGRTRNYEKASIYLREALVTAAHDSTLTLDILVTMGRLWTQQAQYEAAVELLALALHHPAANEKTLSDAERLMLELEHHLEASQIAACWERGKGKKLETALQEISTQRY